MKPKQFLRINNNQAFPTISNFANARVLEVFPDGSFSAHWKANYNTNGDFRTELMMFTSDGIEIKEYKEKMNTIRINNNLIPVSD